MVFKLNNKVNLNNFNKEAFKKRNTKNKNMYLQILQNINIINQISFSLDLINEILIK